MPIRDGGGGDVEFGVRITADGDVYVGATKAATEATKGLTGSLKEGQQAADAAGKSHEDLTGAVVKGTGAVEIAKRAWDETVDVYRQVKEHTEAAQQSQARLEAVLRATNNTSGQSVETIGALADEMARLTRFDDTAIKEAATSLLTFDKVAGNTFERVIKLSADLASTGRGDLQTWITVLGKVGQDPVASIGLLERSLGKLDPALKVAIQNAADFNDKAKAQALVLDEVERRVGGTAQDSYRGLARQMGGTAKAWDDLLKTMGNEIFNAKSKEASVFEQALSHMSDTFKSRIQAMKDAFSSLGSFADVIRVLMGLPPEAVAQKQLGQSGAGYLQDQVAMLNALIAQAKASGSPYADLESNRNAFQTRLNAMTSPAAAPSTVGDLQGTEAAAPSDPLTIRQRQALRDQDVGLQQGYWDKIFSLRQGDVQRSLQLEQQRYTSLLEGDSEYFARVAVLEQQGWADRRAQLQGDLVYEKQQLASAEGELSRASAAFQGGTGGNDAVAAAESKVLDIRAKMRDTTAELADLEVRWDDAEKKRASAQYQADSAQMDRITAINRAWGDVQIALSKRVQGLTTERDLIGKTDEAVRQGNEARALADEYEAKRLDILRKIVDLQGKPGNADEVSRLKEELAALPDMFKDAAEKSRTVISDIFSRKRSADLWGGLVGGLTDTFKAGWDAVVNRTGSAAKAMRDTLKRDLFDWLYAQFAKPFVLNVVASLAGMAGMSGISQAATTAAGGNTIGSSLMGTVTNWAGSTALGSMFNGAAEGFQMGYMSGVASPTAGVGEQFGAYVAQFGAYIMGATAILAGVATSAGLYSAGWHGQPNTGSMGTNNFGFVSGTPIWSPASIVTRDTNRVLSALGLSDRAANILSGTTGIQRLFGWKDPHADAYGLSGDFGAFGASGQNWQDMSRRGGLFRSDQRWTDMSALTSGQSGFLSQLMAPITSAVDRLGSILGVNASSVLSGYSHPFNVQMSNDGKPRTNDEIIADFNEVLGHVLQEQVEQMLRAGGQGALADYVHNLQGAGTDISNTVQAVLSLVGEFDDLGKTISMLDGGPLDQLKLQLKDLNDSVDKKNDTFNEALAGGDPAKILAAEQDLTTAVMNRYQSELSMVEQLSQQIRAIEEQAYQFSINIAQRISSVGGNGDVAGLAFNRSTTLQSRVNAGTGSIADRISDVQSYVGSIDTWYQSRVADINRDAQNAANAANAQSQAAAGAAQAEVQALQKQLDLANAWNDVLKQSQQMIDDMRLSSSNPLGIEGRTQLAQGDVQALMGQYQTATGQDKVDLAHQLMDALTTYRNLGQQAFDRPSDQWQGVYNEIMRDLTAIKGDAKDPAAQAVELQQKILEAQQQANSLGQVTADASTYAAAGMAELNQEALGYYTWAQTNGNALYAQQQQADADALNAITGGVEVSLFEAGLQKEMRDYLKGIYDRLGNAISNGLGTTSNTGGAVPIGGPDPGDSGIPVLKSKSQIIINVQPSQDPVDAIIANATRIKRALDHA